MALLFADSCGQFYSSTAQALSGLYTTLSASIATSGLPSGNVGSTAFHNVTNLIAQVPQTSGTYTVGFRFISTQSYGANENLFAFLDASGNPQLTFQTNSNGTIAVKRGTGSGTLLGTSSTSTVLLTNTWQFVEIAAFCSGSVGTVTIRINGSAVLTLTGQNTQGQATAIIGAMQILGANVNNYVQDLYVTDATGSHNVGFLGDVHVSVYNPTSNGAHTDYTPNGAATLYQSVNAVTPTDSTVFASDANPGDKMSVNLASTSVSGTIAGVINIGRAKKTDSGTRTANLFALNGGTEVDGSSIALGTSYAYSTQVLEVDPNTGVPFTNSGFNTLQIGCSTLT